MLLLLLLLRLFATADVWASLAVYISLHLRGIRLVTVCSVSWKTALLSCALTDDLRCVKRARAVHATLWHGGYFHAVRTDL